MTLTDAQREAALELMRDAYAEMHTMDDALDALTDAGFLLLHESDANLIDWALREIATRPTTELNPDGVDQAAWSMQLIAQEALSRWEPTTKEDNDD